MWADRVPDEELTAALRDCVVLGQVPIETQNLDFIIDQLVETVAGALFSGVNEPFVALNRLDRLTSELVAPEHRQL